MKNQACWYKKVCTNQCTDSCVRYIEMKYLMDNSGIPPTQQQPKKLIPTSDEDRGAFLKLQKIKDNIVKFVNGGYNLYICSTEAGTAKTSWAIKLMLKYFDAIWSGNGLTVRGMFVHVPTLLHRLKDFENRVSHEYLEQLKTCDLVIWDDIATATKLSDYDYNQLLILIDCRTLNNKSNIYTSNVVDREALNNTVGARLASRIYGESKVVEFVSNDCRGGMNV